MKIIVIKPDKTAEVQDVPNEQKYESIKGIIGGYLEALPFSSVATALVDEEAKIRKDKFPIVNRLGTRVMTRFLTKMGRTMIPGDVIINTLVIVGNRNDKGEADGDWYDVPQAVVDEVMQVK